MAKKKKVTQGSGGSVFNFSAAEVNYIAMLKAFGAVAALVAIAFGFVALERYVAKAPNVIHKATRIYIEKPDWASQELMDKIMDVASASRTEDFMIDEHLASKIALNLANNAWISNVQVRINGETIEVSGTWRKPIAIYQNGLREVYIATDCTVLEYVPVINLPLHGSQDRLKFLP